VRNGLQVKVEAKDWGGVGVKGGILTARFVNGQVKSIDRNQGLR